ncbi:MAG: hypothetical protein U5N55_04540 [Cypionkella sp.]|nr:hypothetical protein [Cypionkella sp.]
MQFLPKDVQDGLDAARKGALARKSRLRVELGGKVFPILKFWNDGFALDGSLTTHLRGLVDVFDGARHEFQCLIVASRQEGDMLICDFKRATRVVDRAPLDYFRDEAAPVGYLPRV